VAAVLVCWMSPDGTRAHRAAEWNSTRAVALLNMTRNAFDNREWRPIGTCPSDEDVSLLVSDSKGEYRLPFQCKKTIEGWVNAKTGSLLAVEPTRWHPPMKGRWRKTPT
jgi:hypothetical protein